MNHRLEQFLAAENITQAQFADTIGVARASISHILAGRNKPGYDFIVSTALHYPTLSLDWLLCGKGRMYRGDIFPVHPQPLSPPVSASDVLQAPSSVDGAPSLFGDVEVDYEPETEPEIIMTSEDKVSVSLSSSQNISKIVFFYSDGTFEEYKSRPGI